MKTFKKILKRVLWIIGGFIILIGLYAGAAWGLPYISVNSDFAECKSDAVRIFILTNGVHTDIVVPLVHDTRDWRPFVHPADTKSGSVLAKYVAFGWGDKGFYLDTPTWAELKFSTAFKAAFFLGTSAMHVAFHDTLIPSESCRMICIHKENYKTLVHYIESSFETGSEGNTIILPGKGYGDHDSFYEATGTYNLFFTCNTWANKALKTAGLKACLWTPFDKGIFEKY